MCDFVFDRIRVEHMERQLANLTGLVQKALTHGPPHPSPSPRDYLQVPAYSRSAGNNSLLILLYVHLDCSLYCSNTRILTCLAVD